MIPKDTWVAFKGWSDAHSPDRKSTRLNSSHGYISYAVFCLKKKKKQHNNKNKNKKTKKEQKTTKKTKNEA